MGTAVVLEHWGVPSPLLLSCKITNAALRFLERRGEDLEPLYERFDWPLTYLRDSSSWLEADRLEHILATLEEIYSESAVIETIGHESPQLRAWGALDSVLRIVPGVRELYHQPDRFLASFISPQPMIRDLNRTSESTMFRIEFSDDRFPRTGRYLRASLEALPEFIGKPRAQVLWQHGEIAIAWSEKQVPFAAHASPIPNDGHSLSPDLLRTILVDLANAQRELEESRRAVKERDGMIEALRAQVSQQVAVTAKNSGRGDAGVSTALHELFKLGDYFARAQQLVTLLRGSTTRVQTPAMADVLIKRTAWEHVANEAPVAIRRAAAALQGEIPEMTLPAAKENLGDDESLAHDQHARHRKSPVHRSFFDASP